jgi:GNAT superfamily N-acetyltransferase
VHLARDYKEFHQILSRGKHPSFIGRDIFYNKAKNGGCLLFKFKDEITAVSIINPHYGCLLVLNVIPRHRGHGLGRAIVNFLMPNFARVVEHKVDWFKNCGYIPIGKMKKGVSLKTQIMARKELFTLAGRIKNLDRREEE